MSRPGGVNLPPGFNPNDRKYKKFANALPTRETCDLSSPSEMFLWMLVAQPGMNGGHQAMPSSYNMLVSERLHQLGAMLQCPECGFTKVPELQYVPPSTEDPHWLTSPGTWMKPEDVPVSDKDAIDTALDALTTSQKAALFARLKVRQKGDQDEQ
jgi:hypothetical protein